MPVLDGWDRTARDGFGQPISGAEIDVRVAQDPADEDAGTIQRPTLYADAYGNSTKANPFTTPTDGRVLFHAPDGIYHVLLDDGNNLRVYRNVQLGQGLQALRRVQTVESRSSGGPPASPALDYTYIVDTASGDWSGFNVGDLASYVAGAWTAVTPEVGTGPVYVRDEGIALRYGASMAWEQTGGGGAGLVTPQRYMELIADIDEARDAAGIDRESYENVQYDTFIRSIIGEPSQNLVHTNNEVAIARPNFIWVTDETGVYQFDTNGTKLWAVADDTNSFHNGLDIDPTGVAFVGTANGRVKRIDQNGNVVWDVSVPGEVQGLAANAYGVWSVGALTTDSAAIKHDLSDGSELARWDLSGNSNLEFPYGGALAAPENVDVAYTALQYKDNNQEQHWLAKMDGGAVEQWRFRPLRKRVTAVASTAGGVYWASEDGTVNRNDNGDGNDDQLPDATLQLANVPVTAVAVDPNGKIHAGDADGNIYVLTDLTGADYSIAAHTNRVTGIAGDGNSTTFSVSADATFKQHSSSQSLLADLALPRAALSLGIDSNGNKAVGVERVANDDTQTESLVIFNSSDNVRSRFIPSNMAATAIGINGNGTVFVAVHDPEGASGPEESIIESYDLDANYQNSSNAVFYMNDMGIDPNGKPFVGGRDGSGGGRFALYTTSLSLDFEVTRYGDEVTGVSVSGTPTYWVGTVGERVQEIDGTGAKQYEYYSGTSVPKEIVAEPDDSAVYFLDQNVTIWKVVEDGSGQPVKAWNFFGDSNVITGLYVGPDYVLTIVGESDLYKLDKMDGSVIESVTVTDMSHVDLDADGNIWVLEAPLASEVYRVTFANGKETTLDLAESLSNSLDIKAAGIYDATASAERPQEDLGFVPATVTLYQVERESKAGGGVTFTVQDGDGNSVTLAEGENDVSAFTSQLVTVSYELARNDDYTAPVLEEYGLYWSE